MMRALLICCLLFSTSLVYAKLVDVKIERKTQIQAFGLALEALEGRLYFEFDPALQQNQNIVDLELADRVNGKVLANTTFYAIQPVDPKLRKASLVEISNRGSKASLRYFNKAQGNPNPNTTKALGDGLIQRLGLSVIWIGWQADVYEQDGNMSVNLPIAKNTTGIARSDWTLETHSTSLRLAHRDNIKVLYKADAANSDKAVLTYRLAPHSPKQIVARSAWQFNKANEGIKGDFKPGIYELVYPTNSSIVVGLGFALIRDTAQYIKTSGSTFESPKTIAFGVSQTGRWLRHFMYQGFNETEAGSKAFDGMLIHTAGAGRGSFNHRFAQSSRDAHRMSAFYYPTDVFPFTSREVTQAITNKKDGLLVGIAPQFLPKVMYTNTGYEYWGRAAAYIHTQAGKDIEPLPNERIYHLASAQHFVERQSNIKAIKPDQAGYTDYYQGNPLNLLLNLRAVLSQLSHWVVDEKMPMQSQFPRFSNQSLVSFEQYTLPPRLSKLTKPVSPYTPFIYDYGNKWEQGIISVNPPLLLDLGKPNIPAVPAVDNFGNEIGGIRHPLLDVPIASFLPWVLRHNAEFAQNEMMDFRGAIKLFPKREILAQYQDFDEYINALEGAIDKAIKQGSLLSEDRETVHTQAKWLWELSVGKP